MNFLFTGTVLEKIIVGKPGATEEEAILAVKKLDCLDIIESLPEGFRTNVGENGRIVETGTHSQLLEIVGTYAALHKEFTISHEI